MSEFLKTDPVGETLVKTHGYNDRIDAVLETHNYQVVGKGDFSVVLGLNDSRVFALDLEESLYNPIRSKREYYYVGILHVLHPEHFVALPTAYSPMVSDGQFSAGGTLREKVKIDEDRTREITEKLGKNAWRPLIGRQTLIYHDIPFESYPPEIAQKLYNWISNGLPLLIDPYGESPNIVYDQNGRLIVIDPPHSSYPRFKFDWDFAKLEEFMQKKGHLL